MARFRSLFRRANAVSKKMSTFGKPQQGIVEAIHTYQSGMREATLRGIDGLAYAFIPRDHGDVAIGESLCYQVNAFGEGRLVA